MAIRPADKAVIVDQLYRDDTTVHLVVRVYNDDEEPQYAVACYCDLFVEGEGIKKIDNELAITCEHCLHELSCV